MREKKIPIYWRNEQRTNRVSGVGMATGFERGVCRLIDAGSKPINWSNSSPFDGRGGRISVSSLCVRGCACHQTAWPCLKFRTPAEYRYSPLAIPNFSRTISKDIIGPTCACDCAEDARGHACMCMYVHNRKLQIANFVKMRKDQQKSNNF